MIILIIFEFSYLFRAMIDLFLNTIFEKKGPFVGVLLIDMAYIFEGMSFAFLLGTHFKNFKLQGSA